MKRQKAALCLLCALALGVTPARADDDASAEFQNTAPVAENMELETYREVSVGGRLEAHDAEGDAVTFEVVTEPMKGTVELSSDGYFIYTPAEGKRGKDYFGFRAVDEHGNHSQEGTVIIKIMKQKSAVTYADMGGDGTEYAAIAMTETGIFTGKAVGSAYMFEPDAAVSRGDFLSMCMDAADCDLLSGVVTTGFLDDDAIGDWLKPYVSTALLNGYVRGVAAEGGAEFLPDDSVTLRDACVMLNAVLGVTDVVSASAYIGEDSENTQWVQAAANLTACGIMPDRWEDWDAALTRSQAAEMLQRAMNLLEAR